MTHPLPVNHFLSLPRPTPILSPPVGVVDTTTLAAHDFDVDTRTGFMPPDPPLTRLPIEWELWERALDDAVQKRLQLGHKFGLTEEEKATSEAWRADVRNMPLLPPDALATSELLLRRAHHVLAWVMHFYIHSQPPSDTPTPVHIPTPLSVPLLVVSKQLSLPPLLTYSDDVLYNWALTTPSPFPTITNLRCTTLFTSTHDEETFYLTSARIELAGVTALSLMRATMDEAFVNDSIAHSRITTYLTRLASTIETLTQLLLAVRDGCDPEVFYNDVRPWFRGADSSAMGWVFDGIEEFPELRLEQPTELSGPSAGQSSLVHALDIFLGVDEFSHSASLTGHSNKTPASTSTMLPSSSTTTSTASGPSHQNQPFLTRMQTYMPRHHRAFLTHLTSNPRPLRRLVLTASPTHPPLLEAYNAAVKALKAFRDAHVIIVALYIIGPARRAREREREREGEVMMQGIEGEGDGEMALKGTGGTELVQFLKGVRDRTAAAVVSGYESQSQLVRGNDP